MEHKNRWLMKSVSEEDVEELAKKAGISKLLAKIFLGREIQDVDYIRKFLNPCLEELHNPYLLKDMNKAVERILTAIDKGERILIYGDYDVDGVTSTSILYDFLLSIKAKVDYFIPDRLEEGYGLSIGAIDRIFTRSRVELVITVDCGVTAFDEVDYLIERDADVIITDHHECKESLPRAFAVINPCRHDCTYPFKDLAGVGVTFKLIEAIAEKMNLESVTERYLDLVALGTVADVVPLSGENRIIVKNGLDIIEKTSNIGLRSIIKVAGIEGRKITSSIISFMLAPRVNAAGRIGDAGRAVKLLTTDDEEEAMSLAKELDELNRYRQDSEMEILKEVENIINTNIDLEKEKVIVVSGPGWHHGIIGIVASKITEKYNRPCILISAEEDVGKGSGRSIEGFNIFKALEYCEPLLERYGGHELAAGLTLKTQYVEEFRHRINDFAGFVLEPSIMIPKIKIDACIAKEYLTLDGVRELEMLAPFGANNPVPVFALYDYKINEIRTVGQDKHIKLRLSSKDFAVDAIGFNKGELVNVYNEDDVVDIACSVDVNVWNGYENVQLIIKDIKGSSETLMENNYYFSLDKCIDFEYEYSDNDINIIFSKIKQTEQGRDIAGVIEQALKAGGPVAVFVNSLNSLKMLLCDMGKLPETTGYNLFYSEYEMDDINKLYIIVNPDPKTCSFDEFDKIIIYGDWILRDYLMKLATGIDLSKLYVYNKISFIFCDDITLTRQDLVAAYQYIKTYNDNQFILEDLFAFARKLVRSYRIPMNYFKIKRIFQVFEELKLLTKTPYGEYGLLITMNDNQKSKTNLDNSKLFRSLRKLSECKS